jgi:hypothetical protein
VVGGQWSTSWWTTGEVKTMMEGISCVLNATWADSLGLIGLYTDESPGLKVDPVVVLVLSRVHLQRRCAAQYAFSQSADSVTANTALVIAKVTRRFSS